MGRGRFIFLLVFVSAKVAREIICPKEGCPNGFTGRQKTIVGGREIILQREPGDKAGVTWREGEIKGTNKARLPFVMPVNDAMPDEPL